MAILIFRLRNVPEDEADEVRSLLEQNAIDTYETSAGNWKISMPGIWLRDESQLEKANELLAAYQRERYRLSQEELKELKNRGELKTFRDNFVANPVKVTLYLGSIALVLYLSLQYILALQ